MHDFQCPSVFRVGVCLPFFIKTLYEVFSVLSEISRELKNRRISFSSIDTTRSYRDRCIAPFNFKSQHRCELERAQKRALSMKSLLPFLRGGLCSMG